MYWPYIPIWLIASSYVNLWRGLVMLFRPLSTLACFQKKIICYDLSTRVFFYLPLAGSLMSLSLGLFLTMDNYTKTFDHAKTFDVAKAFDCDKALLAPPALRQLLWKDMARTSLYWADQWTDHDMTNPTFPDSLPDNLLDNLPDKLPDYLPDKMPCGIWLACQFTEPHLGLFMEA